MQDSQGVAQKMKFAGATIAAIGAVMVIFWLVALRTQLETIATAVIVRYSGAENVS